MHQILVLNSIFLLFLPGVIVTLEKGVEITLDTKPQVLETSKTGQEYLQAHEMQSLQLVFKNRSKMSEGPFDCIVQKSNGGPHRLNGDKFGSVSLLHFVLLPSMTGEIICVSRIYRTEMFKLFVFVAANDKRYFSHNSHKYDSSNLILNIKCLGGYYSEGTVLRIDGKRTNYPYDPMSGFSVNISSLPNQHFYECIKNPEFLRDDVVSQHFGNEVPTPYQKFDAVLYEKNDNSRVLKCIASSNDTGSLHNIEMFVSCGSSVYCSQITRYSNSTNQLTLAVVIPNSLPISMNFSCVFRNADNHIFVRTLAIDPIGIYMAPFIIMVLVILIAVIGFSIYKVFLEHNMRVCEVPFRIISSSSFKLDEKNMIGNGFSSTIYKTTWPRNEKETVAVKISTNLNMIANEAHALSKLNHPNIIKPLAITKRLQKTFLHKTKIDGLVLEHFGKKSLDKYLPQYSSASGNDMGNPSNLIFTHNRNSRDYLTTRHLVSFAWQLSATLVYLKQHNCVHRDLALRNILVTDSGIIKLIDFERSRFGETQLKSKLKKICWRFWKKYFGKAIPFKTYSLEALEGNYTFSSEVWAFGIVLLEIFSFGSEAFPQIQNLASYEFFLRNFNKIEKPIHCPPEIFDQVITKCLCKDINERQEIETSERILRDYLMQFSQEEFRKLDTQLTNEFKRISTKSDSVHYVSRNHEMEILLSRFD